MESERRYLQSAKLGANLAVSGAIAFYHHCEGQGFRGDFRNDEVKATLPPTVFARCFLSLL